MRGRIRAPLRWVTVDAYAAVEREEASSPFACLT